MTNFIIPVDQKVIFFAPHPDDEVIAGGAILNQLSRKKNTIHIVYLTSGSNVDLFPEREKEANRVCQILDASPHFLRFDRKTRSDDYLQQIVELMKMIRPGLIFLPTEDDPHPAHQFVHTLVSKALIKILYTGRQLSYSIWSPLPHPDVLIKYSGKDHHMKFDLLSNYSSQLKHHDFHSGISGRDQFFGMIAQEQHQHRNSFSEIDVEKCNDGEITYAEAFMLAGSDQAPEVLAVGDIFLDILPDPVTLKKHEGTTIADISFSPGGNATNFALALSKLGTPTALVTKSGRTWKREILEDSLNQGEVVTFFLKSGDQLPTGKDNPINTISNEIKESYHFHKDDTATTIAQSYTDGSRHFISDLGGLPTFSPSELPDLSSDFKHVHRAGYFWLPRLRGSVTADFLKSAKDAHMTTSMDIGTPPDMPGVANPWELIDGNEILPILPFVDIFFGNESEVLELGTVIQRSNDPSYSQGGDRKPTTTSDVQMDTNATVDQQRKIDHVVLIAAHHLLEGGVGMVVIHQGHKGARLITKQISIHYPTIEIIPNNPTGAGDIFNAAFIHAYEKGMSENEVLAFAVAAGTFHVKYKENPYPTMIEVLGFQKQQEFQRLA